MKKEKAPAFREQAVKEAGARSMEEAMMTAYSEARISFDYYDKEWPQIVNLVKLPVLGRKSNRWIRPRKRVPSDCCIPGRADAPIKFLTC